MKQAIFYLSYNGIFNLTNGVGTQAKTFIDGITKYKKSFYRKFGKFDVHAITQLPKIDDWGYSPSYLKEMETKIDSLGGKIHFAPYEVKKNELWSVTGWTALSTSAASIILNASSQYDRILVIATDTPFVHTPLIIESAKQNSVFKNKKIESLIALYGSGKAHIFSETKEKAERVEWERSGLIVLKDYKNVKMGRYGDYMYHHFNDNYGTNPAEWVPYKSSLLTEDIDFEPFTQKVTEDILKKYNIPLNKPIIFGFGRAVHLKGFDILIKGMKSVINDAHLVLNMVSYQKNEPFIKKYKQLIEKYQIKATLLEGYKRELPKALSQWKNSVAVVCPSRADSLSNIPFEVALWAKNEGPIIIGAALQGFLEQIKDGVDGFLFESSGKKSLGNVLKKIMNLSDQQRQIMRINAYKKVSIERNFKMNFENTLSNFWEAK